MNRYASGQRFLGLRSVLLDNTYRDISGIRDRVAMKVYARFNLPAPRISHARLLVNGEYAGVYAVVEELGEDFVRRVFRLPDSDEPDKGTLYEYKWIEDWNFRYLGGDLETYRPRFEARTHENDSTTDLYAPIEELVRDVNQTPIERFVDEVGELLDLRQLMVYMGVETFLVDYDGFVGYKGMANFYLYRDAVSTRHRLFVWDKDTTFFDPAFSILTRTADNVIFRRALSVPSLRSLYLQVLSDCARAAAADGWLEAEVNRAVSLIDAAAREDPRKRFTNEEFDAAVALVREFARIRPNFVLQEVARP
jgi:spore coat protein CotH